jgi:predicted DNA-binding protein with PD1-like motif
MEYFKTGRAGKIYALRLDQGDFVLESIKKLISAEKIRNGVVVSGIGTLDMCTMHMVATTGYPIVEYFDRHEGKALELVVIQGIIADGVPHLHMVVSDQKQAYAGHLEEGCRILYLGEIVIQELPDFNLTRIVNKNNVKLLVEADGSRPAQ